MAFTYTPEEAQPIARAVARHFERLKMQVCIERAPWADCPYRTSLFAHRGGLHVIIEAQGALDYHKPLKEFASWLGKRRQYAELFLATGADSATRTGVLGELRNDGVGLLIVDEHGLVTEEVHARNSALVMTPDPTLKYGDCKDEVLAAVKKFNDVNRKDGLRDMCELVEGETEKLGVLAVNKALLRLRTTDFTAQNWSGQINTLASSNAYNSGHSPPPCRSPTVSLQLSTRKEISGSLRTNLSRPNFPPADR